MQILQIAQNEETHETAFYFSLLNTLLFRYICRAELKSSCNSVRSSSSSSKERGASTCIREIGGSNLDHPEVFRSSLQSLQVNSEIVPQIRTRTLTPNFQ
jgi:hypothetical protein